MDEIFFWSVEQHLVHGVLEQWWEHTVDVKVLFCQKPRGSAMPLIVQVNCPDPLESLRKVLED
jgi:hypothetical protein